MMPPTDVDSPPQPTRFDEAEPVTQHKFQNIRAIASAPAHDRSWPISAVVSSPPARPLLEQELPSQDRDFDYARDRPPDGARLTFRHHGRKSFRRPSLCGNQRSNRCECGEEKCFPSATPTAADLNFDPPIETRFLEKTPTISVLNRAVRRGRRLSGRRRGR
jgi:hypothetical protein